MRDPMTYHLPVRLTGWQVAALLLLLLQFLLTDVSCLPAKYRCQEESAEGSFVANISAGIDGSTVGYSIFRTVPNVSEMFRLDADSGRLTVGRRLDREAICPQKDNCVVVLDVAISNSAVLSHIVKVEVTVDDVNDNEPRFGDVIVRKSLLESTPESLVLELSPAVDPDSPENGVSGYHLEETDGPFRLEVYRNRITNTVGLRLLLTGRLDREKVNRYDLRVKAVDAGQPPRTGAMTIEIDVTDVNDNSPRFANGTYEATLDSDAPAGTTVIQVMASDPDEGANGQVRYYLAKRSRVLYGGVFEVREDSGEVVTTRRLNETGTRMLASYRLDVVAEDRGENAIPTQTSVRIRTKSVNRQAPAIRISAVHHPSNLSSLSVVEISENNLPMAFVCHVTVGDDDIGPSGQVTCSLDDDSDDDFRLVSMGEKKFKVVALRSFDREVKDLYALTLTCADLGTPPMTSQERFVVRIDDVDDNEPRFVRPEYDCSVVENAAAAVAPLVRVQAVDPDEGFNGEVEYSLGSDADSRIFRIDVRTGDLFVLRSLDRETMDSYEFHVRARSSKVKAVGSASEVTCLVHVTVLDVDDERPRFQNATYKFKVAENENSGTEVGRVKAVDLDLPPNDRVVYRLEFVPEDHVTAASFAIDPVLGIVYTRQVLDREAISHHTMRVITTDPRDISNATGGDVTIVFVEVDDVNDNAPVVTYPTAGDDAVHLVRNASSGRQRNVANLTAYDRDVGPNADLRYSIVGGNDDRRRSYLLDPRTGSLFWTPEVTIPGADHCADVIDIVVRDNGFPVTLTSSTRLFVFFDCVEEEGEEDDEDDDEIDRPFGDVTLGHNGPSLFFVVLIMAMVLLVLLFVVVVAKVGGRRRGRSDHVIGSKGGGATAAFDVAAARYQGDGLGPVNRGSDETLSGLVIMGDAQLDNCSRENETNEQKKIPGQADEIDESTSGNERDNDSGCVDVSAVETKERPPVSRDDQFQIHFIGSESGLSSRCHSN